MMFQEGDKVEVISGCYECVHIGKQTTIIGLARIPDHLYVDLPPSPLLNQGQPYAQFLPRNLRKIDGYDGNQASTWEDLSLIWQPKELVVING